MNLNSEVIYHCAFFTAAIFIPLWHTHGFTHLLKSKKISLFCTLPNTSTISKQSKMYLAAIITRPVSIHIYADSNDKISSAVLCLENMLNIPDVLCFLGASILEIDSHGVDSLCLLSHENLCAPIALIWLPCHASCTHFLPSSGFSKHKNFDHFAFWNCSYSLLRAVLMIILCFQTFQVVKNGLHVFKSFIRKFKDSLPRMFILIPVLEIFSVMLFIRDLLQYLLLLTVRFLIFAGCWA